MDTTSHPVWNTDKTVQHGCYAGIPGTGPSGEICSRCSLLEPQGAKFVCSQYQRITGRKGKPISPAKSACRYFSKRPAFNSVKGAV